MVCSSGRSGLDQHAVLGQPDIREDLRRTAQEQRLDQPRGLGIGRHDDQRARDRVDVEAGVAVDQVDAAAPVEGVVTGAAGFIGYHLARTLLDRGDKVIGLDNLNDYYDVRLKEARLAHAGDRSPLALANREIGALPPQAKAEAGKRMGIARGTVNEALKTRKAELEAERDARVLVEEAVDVTLPYDRRPVGARHPLTTIMERIEDVFVAMGWEVAEGPEVEAEWLNFDALNLGPDHPARSMQDTSKEKTRLAQENESLRMQVSRLNEKPDNKLHRELEIMARAEKHMMINAPGFAPAWEMAKSQALSQIETEEKGMSFPQKIFRKLIGPSSSATNVALPESAMNAAKNAADMTSNAA